MHNYQPYAVRGCPGHFEQLAGSAAGGALAGRAEGMSSGMRVRDSLRLVSVLVSVCVGPSSFKWSEKHVGVDLVGYIIFS